MIKVWTDAAGGLSLLDGGYRIAAALFAYLPGEPVSQRAVSVTMPVRLPSWDVPFGLAPIFEMRHSREARCGNGCDSPLRGDPEHSMILICSPLLAAHK